LNVSEAAGGTRLNWTRGDTNCVPRWWVVQSKTSGAWKTEILPKEISSITLPGAPDTISVTIIDRVGNASTRRVMELVKTPQRKRILLEKR